MITMYLVIILLIILIVVVYAYRCKCAAEQQNLQICRICDQDFDLSANAVINPFIYPYSATDDTSEVYAQTSAGLLEQRSLPDHDIKTA